MSAVRPTLCLVLLTLLPSAAQAAAHSVAQRGADPGPRTYAQTYPTGQDDDSKKAFRDGFTKAMGFGSKSEMAQLVERNTDEAVAWIVETAEYISNSPNDVLFERMAALCEAWSGAYGTGFCRKMETYFSLLEPVSKRQRARLKRGYLKQVGEYLKNINGPKDIPVFTRVGVELEGLASGFKDIGDYYFESQCWLHVGTCFDEYNLKGKADLKRATKAYERFIATREEIGLKDAWYGTIKPRVTELMGLGFGSQPVVRRTPVAATEGGEAGAEGAGGAEGEGAPRAGPIEAAMHFEVVEKIDAFQRPNFFLDELYPMWHSMGLNRKGSRSTFPRLESAPDLLRVGFADIQVDADRDGEGDVKIPLSGNFEPVVIEIGEGPEKRSWGFLAVTGHQKNIYQSIEINLEPTDDLVNVYVVAAASMVGGINGTKIRVIDDNVDGVYGSPATTWGHVGMTKGNFQPEMDSMVIGRSKRAIPWSEFVKIGAQWYQLEPLDQGKRILAHPVELPTGLLKLKFKGPKPSYVIVKGANDFENSYFDLASGKTVEVPIGRYSLYFGIVKKGKKKQVLKSIMIPSDTTPSWDVMQEGEEVIVELGAPFGFDFETSLGEREIVIEGESVCVIGRANERYERIWGAVPRPSASYRTVGSKKRSRPEDMERLIDQDELYQPGGYQASWFPKDLVLTKKPKETEVQVQLMEKKNKLFGKIESIWK